MRLERRVRRHRNHAGMRIIEVTQCAGNGDIRMSHLTAEPVVAWPFGSLGFQNAKCAADLRAYPRHILIRNLLMKPDFVEKADSLVSQSGRQGRDPERASPFGLPH